MIVGRIPLEIFGCLKIQELNQEFIDGIQIEVSWARKSQHGPYLRMASTGFVTTAFML